MKCIEREVRLRGRKGRRSHVSVVREHYLRDDISCKAEKCCICGHQNPETRSHSGSKGILLRPDASHYAIPDVPSLSQFLEVFEQPGITGCILLQTVLIHIQSRRRLHRQAKALLSSPVKNFVMFSNEYHLETFSQRNKDESMEEWQQRLVYTAGVWYTNHLQVSDIRLPIVIVTPHPQNYSRFEVEKTSGLKLLSIEEYLQWFWPELTDIRTLLQSLMGSIQSSEDPGNPFPTNSTYLADDVIHENLKKGLLYSGRLRVSQYHTRDEAFVVPLLIPGDSGQLVKGSDIFIPGSVNRNRAIHGDLVAIKLHSRSQWRSRNHALPIEEGQKAEEAEGEVERTGCNAMPTGTVIGILQRADRLYVASFDDSSTAVHRGRSEKLLVCPYDHRIPKVRISTRQAEDLKQHRIVIHIDSWEVGSQYPNGHFVRSIGPIGDIETETAVILVEHEVAVGPFSKALLEELPSSYPKEPWVVDEAEITEKGRRDLRHTHLILSIDPEGCEDVDDALSVRSLGNGKIELGVHIADVSHFVSPGSLTDREARERSTTVYMADRRYDMLPAILSADLCSLLSNVDRYAVSILWVLDGHYQVQDVWYGKTVIRSSYKLAYETAQALFDGVSSEKLLAKIPELQLPLPTPSKMQRIEELRAAVGYLVDITRVLKERRGGLELEGVEVRVQINDNDRTVVEDLIPKQPLEMHETIAECMIFANNWVAMKLQGSYPTRALLRRHPSPAQERFSQLVSCAESRGFTMETWSNKALARSLDNCVDPTDPDLNRIFRYLATQTMVQAEYCCASSQQHQPPQQYHHYGLDLDLYTHFTSPIRRYADLVVHRQLLAAVGDSSTDPNSLPSSSHLHEMAQHMNKKRRCGQLAQIASTEMFQGLYFSSKSGSDTPSKEERREIDAVVIGLRSNGILAFSLRYGIRAPVYLRDRQGLVAQPDPTSPNKVMFDSGTLTSSEQSITVSYSSGQYTLQILDRVRVFVTSKISHAHGYSLCLELLKCGPIPPSSQALSAPGEMGGEEEKRKTKQELIRIVRDEVGRVEGSDTNMADTNMNDTNMAETEYHQTRPEKSLYSTMQRMRRLALEPIS